MIGIGVSQYYGQPLKTKMMISSGTDIEVAETEAQLSES
jgi:hypothetical protein